MQHPTATFCLHYCGHESGAYIDFFSSKSKRLISHTLYCYLYLQGFLLYLTGHGALLPCIEEGLPVVIAFS